LNDISAKSIGELNIGNKNVQTIKDYYQVVEALKLVALQHISAVGVVNKEDQFIGEIGAHDLRELNKSNSLMDMILLPIKDYISQHKKTPPTVHPNSTFGEVLHCIEENHLHRVFVVENQKVVGIISLGDIIQCVLDHNKS